MEQSATSVAAPIEFPRFGWAATLASALTALALSMVIATTVLATSVGDNADWAFGVGVSVMVVFATAFGWLIIRARPRNVVGWLLLAQALATASVAFTEVWVEYKIRGGAEPSLAVRYVAVYSNGAWPLLFAGFAAIAYVFPDGHFFSRKYKRWGAFTAISLAMVLIGTFFSSEPMSSGLESVDSPLPGLPPALEAVSFLLVFGFLAGLIASAFAVRARLRASTGDARIQMLWLAWAALWIPATLALCFVDGVLLDESGGPLTVVGLAVMGVMMPLAIAIGILRYRLFDIELVINRTVVYGVLTVCVAAVYVAVVSCADLLLSSRGVAGLIAVGVVAAMIQPLHARLQTRVDRWIYGDRANPYAALQRLDSRLRETLTPTEVVQTVVDSVAEALRLPYAAVEFGRGGEGQVIASHGSVGRGELTRRALSYRGESVGTLTVEVPPGRSLAGADESLLDDLASHVGVAVQSVSLTIDLQNSRKDLVTAREEERRRMRRDLHDGVGPTLAAMSLKLEVLRDRVDGDGAPLVDQLGEEVQEAIADIRRLVYALRPPALDEYGLLPALAEQASRLSSAGSTIDVDGPADLPPLPAATEVAIYRIALEAMTNAKRHSGAERCIVTLSMNGGVELKVLDDGDGFPPGARRGIGLSSMSERADELGGSLTVDSKDGVGTTITAWLPLEQHV
jgi:signal transduction histidine kinase